MFNLRFVMNPSSKDDSNEPRNLSLIIHSSIAINATNFIMVYINVTFYVKIGLYLFLDNLEQNTTSYRGRNKVKTSKDTLKINFENIFKMYKNHDANHCECIAIGSYKDNGANAHTDCKIYFLYVVIFQRNFQ